jgi:hypothetical protein
LEKVLEGIPDTKNYEGGLSRQFDAKNIYKGGKNWKGSLWRNTHIRIKVRTSEAWWCTCNPGY